LLEGCREGLARGYEFTQQMLDVTSRQSARSLKYNVRFAQPGFQVISSMSAWGNERPIYDGRAM
jgi:hypothetical protein